MDKRQALYAATAMGYRPMDPDRKMWGKPFGNSLLLFSVDAMELKQIFRAVNGHLRCWTTSVFDESILTGVDESGGLEDRREDPEAVMEAVISWIRSIEMWQVRGDLGVAPPESPTFEFLTASDRADLFAKEYGL